MVATTTAPIISMPAASGAALALEAFSLSYGGRTAVAATDLAIPRGQVTAIIGPSGCGKSTLLRGLNRLHETVPGARATGRVLLEGLDVYGPTVDPMVVRRRIGMVFQQPNPLPSRSIEQNVAIGLELIGVGRLSRVRTVAESLQRAALWDEVRDRLGEPATALSGGQQQRLCIARALAVDPEVLLMDEPTSALDPLATSRIEELIQELARDYTIVIVTHNMQQAARVSDFTVFMSLNDEGVGQVFEAGPTRSMFTAPKSRRTEDYITGRFG